MNCPYPVTLPRDGCCLLWREPPRDRTGGPRLGPLVLTLPGRAAILAACGLEARTPIPCLGIFLAAGHFPKELLGSNGRECGTGLCTDRMDRCANATRLEANACVGPVAVLP